ncbi:hypothetical protein [uncultured Tenacibaculum sp.]|uniref:hypothetical protein n=1 Tax=uncultured Tenacibaculum sp. TaxID=174713 RepID=UPI002609F797|nr:hypothetical protein [uncultured Tenacibaculum sp.]
MKKPNLLTISLLFLFSICFGQQKDSIYGKVKKIREKVEFLTEKENPQFLYYDDYGHSGFMGPESTISRFNRTWYSTQFCYYINYERHFNQKGKITKDIWFTKKDSFMDSYKYKYDKKDRLTRKIDSSKYSVGTETHYYENDYHENIVYENFEYDIFSFKYKRFDAEGKLIRFKSHDDYGNTDEYIYKYNADGKLLYRIYKNPNSWKKIGEKSWSYGAHDSIGSIYKDFVYRYDESNRLIQRQRFDLYEDDENHKNPKLVENIFYEYDKNNNLIQTKRINGYIKVKPTFNHSVYDKKNRLIKRYCCSEKESDAKRVEKYIYKDDKIISLEYKEEDWPSKEMKKYQVDFEYKYDAKGNWNEIIKKVNGVQLYKWIRKIEYYK